MCIRLPHFTCHPCKADDCKKWHDTFEHQLTFRTITDSLIKLIPAQTSQPCSTGPLPPIASDVDVIKEYLSIRQDYPLTCTSIHCVLTVLLTYTSIYCGFKNNTQSHHKSVSAITMFKHNLQRPVQDKQSSESGANIPPARLPTPLRHTPKHLRPYVWAVMAFKNGSDFHARLSKHRSSRLNAVVKKEGNFTTALSVRCPVDPNKLPGLINTDLLCWNLGRLQRHQHSRCRDRGPRQRLPMRL